MFGSVCCFVGRVAPPPPMYTMFDVLVTQRCHDGPEVGVGGPVVERLLQGGLQRLRVLAALVPANLQSDNPTNIGATPTAAPLLLLLPDLLSVEEMGGGAGGLIECPTNIWYH